MFSFRQFFHKPFYVVNIVKLKCCIILSRVVFMLFLISFCIIQFCCTMYIFYFIFCLYYYVVTTSLFSLSWCPVYIITNIMSRLRREATTDLQDLFPFSCLFATDSLWWNIEMKSLQLVQIFLNFPLLLPVWSGWWCDVWQTVVYVQEGGMLAHSDMDGTLTPDTDRSVSL